jgi:phospholipid transport system substrate-binding protein
VLKKLHAVVLGFFMLGAVWAAQAAQPVVDTRPPDVLIREVSSQALAALRANPSVKSGDIARINQLIDEQLAPYVDFSRTTQITVGRHWASASAQQREQLARELRTLLVLVYAGGLRNFGDQRVEYRPFQAAPDETDVVVRTFVINKGQPVQVDYRLHKTPAGWKIYDVNVLGLWLTEAYRNQFAPILNEGGVPNLLKALETKNATLYKSAGK